MSDTSLGVKKYEGQVINGFEVIKAYPRKKNLGIPAKAYVKCTRCGRYFTMNLYSVIYRKGTGTSHCKHLNIRAWNPRLKNIFHGMRKRCYDPTDKSYNRYGARGIKICDEWMSDHLSFQDWAFANGYIEETGTDYKDTMSIDRIDKDGDYSPENCQWITVSENSAKDKAMFVDIDNNTKTLSKWSLFFGLNSQYFSDHVRQFGIEHVKNEIKQLFKSPDKAILRKRNRTYEVNGISLTLTQWEERLGLRKRYLTYYKHSHGRDDNCILKRISELLEGDVKDG